MHEYLAERLIADTLAVQNITADQLTIHADRGSSMTSRTVAQLLSDLGVTRSHSRPRVSNNDNPFSEAHKTLKYRPDFPDRFTSIEQVHRGEQRALYDARRDSKIPAHGLRLVVIRPADLDSDNRGRLRRNVASDLAVIRKLFGRTATKTGSHGRVPGLVNFRRTPVAPTDPWNVTG